MQATSRAYARYSTYIADMRENKRQPACGWKDLSILESKATGFKNMLVVAFDKHSDYGLYAVIDHLLDQMAEDIRRFGRLPVPDNSPYKSFNSHLTRCLKKLCKEDG